jgi:hypothetical protein
VFTARYALSPYIKQIRFVFKGLIRLTTYYFWDAADDKFNKFLLFLSRYFRLLYHGVRHTRNVTFIYYLFTCVFIAIVIWNRDRIVRIVIRLRTGRSGARFSATTSNYSFPQKYPDRLWDPPSYLFSGYRNSVPYPGYEATRAWFWLPTSIWCRRLGFRGAEGKIFLIFRVFFYT